MGQPVNSSPAIIKRQTRRLVIPTTITHAAGQSRGVHTSIAVRRVDAAQAVGLQLRVRTQAQACHTHWGRTHGPRSTISQKGGVHVAP
jgi:hypothetical protein